MHHALLSYVAQHRETVVPCRLRFIRSGGALLSPQVLAELENLFQAPVLVSYGMTEASAQITCNPLPPRPRKLGSVGVAAGPKVAIMDAMGSILPVGTMGEIVIRGASVTPGYDNDLTTTRQAFTHGWFRTGDQGYLDADGYLFITGRTQEFINRGGEKIAPQEVDDVLMKHPAIAQAITFAMPHARLGEEVAAAVVLHPHARATDHDIRQFATAHLATFKVPQRIVIVDDLPKGPTGKLQRVIWRSNSV